MRLNCYDLPSEDEEFDVLFELRARPIVLGLNSAIADGERFETAAGKIFLMDSQLRDVLRRLIEAARIHGESHLGLDRAYVAGLHKTKENPWGTEFPTAICLASHAGVGKSQLLKALERVLGEVVVGSVEGVRGIAHRGVWSLSIRDGTGWNAILGRHVRGIENGERGGGQSSKSSTLLSSASKASWREAACLITVDEFQFMSQGADTNAKATSLLLRLQAIGPRLVYSVNFDMASRLLRRRKEDKDRIIFDWIVLSPWSTPCDSLIRFLNELKRLCPKVFVFDPDKAQAAILDYTFGIRRNIVRLLRVAYVASRRRGGRGVVGEEELALAYASAEYSVAREDVVLLIQQSITRKAARGDLWNPWHEPTRIGESVAVNAQVKAEPQSPKVVEATAAKLEFERRVSDKYISDSLTPAEAAAVESVNPRADRATSVAKVIPIKRSRTTDEDLLAGEKALDELDAP